MSHKKDESWQARISEYALKILPLFTIVSNISSIYDCLYNVFLFWNIFSIILFSGIFCCNRTKICFVLRQFFHSQTLASHQQKWHLRLVLRYFPFSEKFAFSFLLFALYFLLLHCLLKMALLLASQSWLFLKCILTFT